MEACLHQCNDITRRRVIFIIHFAAHILLTTRKTVWASDLSFSSIESFIFRLGRALCAVEHMTFHKGICPPIRISSSTAGEKCSTSNIKMLPRAWKVYGFQLFKRFITIYGMAYVSEPHYTIRYCPLLDEESDHSFCFFISQPGAHLLWNFQSCNHCLSIL